MARTDGIRLRWHAGYVSEYPDPLDDDTQEVTLDADKGIVTLHAKGGWIFRFVDSRVRDEDGYAIYREVGREEQADHPPDAPSRALLPPAETFDYAVTVPATGSGERWRVRTREEVDGAAPRARGCRLVGSSPHLHIEHVGLLRGGGQLSPLCHVIRPTVSASRIVLTALDRTDATASAAWFHLDRGLVDVLRPGDDVNLTRTPRGGLGLSVIRDGELLVALGAATAVPVGGDLEVIVRRDRLVRAIPFGESAAGFPWVHPVEFTSAGRVPRKPKSYSMSVWCSAWPPPEDSDENVSIIRGGAYPEGAAFASAHLLGASDALHVVR